MADYITKILTATGEKQIDYTALANLPDVYTKSEADKAEIAALVSQNSYAKQEILSDTTKTAYGLNTNAIPDDALKICSGKIGDIVHSKRKDFLTAIGAKYLPCNGQIIDGSQYPDLKEAIGSISQGYLWERKATSEYPSNFNNIQYIVEASNGRIFCYNGHSNYLGIFYSDNEGETWTRAYSFTESPSARDLLVSNKSGRILLINKKSIIYSDDNGVTWKTKTFTKQIGSHQKTACQTSNGRIISIGGNDNEIYYSDNDGINWTNVTLNQTISNMVYIYALSNGNVILGTESNSKITLYLSKDNGITWGKVYDLVDSSNAFKVFEMDNSQLLIIGKTYKAVSCDFGETWNIISKEDVPFSGSTFDFFKIGNSIFWSGYISCDLGKTWTQVPSPYPSNSELFGVQLSNGKFIAAPYGGSNWYFSSQDANIIQIPNSDGDYIVVKGDS